MKRLTWGQALILLGVALSLAFCLFSCKEVLPDPKQTQATLVEALACDRLGSQVIEDSSNAGKTCEQMKEALRQAGDVFPRCQVFFRSVSQIDCKGR